VLLNVKLGMTLYTRLGLPFRSKAATQSGVAPRRSPVPGANVSNAPFFG